jgi:hypothetical protein
MIPSHAMAPHRLSGYFLIPDDRQITARASWAASASGPNRFLARKKSAASLVAHIVPAAKAGCNRNRSGRGFLAGFRRHRAVEAKRIGPGGLAFAGPLR